MVRIRMKRMGRRHRPFYRINAVEKRTQRDGRVLENLGWYNPIESNPEKQVSLNAERIQHWLSNGAQASDTVNDLLAKHGIIDADEWNKLRERKRKGRYAEVIAAKEAEKAAAEAEAKAAAEAAAAEAAEAAAAAEGGDEEKTEEAAAE
jgi:small subunit ribosomal protein S16